MTAKSCLKTVRRTTRKINQCIILFAREPVLGTVKSRLSSALSPNDTLTLYEKLLIQAINTSSHCTDAETQLFGTPSIDHPLFKSYAQSHQLSLRVQSSGDLGERMTNAAENMLRTYKRVAIIGSDCPFISQSYIEAAFNKLNKSQLVFGPATDGGFVLVACATSGLLDKIFTGVVWGESSVLESVLENATAENISYDLLPPLQDIDRPEDLELLEQVTWFE